MLASKERQPTDDPKLPSYQSEEYRDYFKYLIFTKLMQSGKSSWVDLLTNQVKTDLAKMIVIPFPEEEEEIYKFRIQIGDWQSIYNPALREIPGVINEIRPRDTTFKRLNQDMSDISMDSNSLKAVMTFTDTLVLRDQSCFLYIDFHSEGEFTEGEILATPSRPFLKVYERVNLINWEYNLGKFKYAVLREPYKNNYRYRVLKEGGVSEVYEIHEDENGQFSSVLIGEPLFNSLGYIPLIMYSHDTIDPWNTPPPLMDIAELQRSQYRLSCEDRLAMIYQGFNILVTEGKSMNGSNLQASGGSKKPNIKVGVTKGLLIPSDSKAYYIAPDPSWALIYQTRVKDIIERANQLSMKFIGDSQKNRIYKSKMEVEADRSNNESELMTLVEQKLSTLDRIEKVWCDYYGVQQIYGLDEYNNFEIGSEPQIIEEKPENIK